MSNTTIRWLIMVAFALMIVLAIAHVQREAADGQSHNDGFIP